MAKVRSEHALSPKPHLLRNTLRSRVVRIGDELEPLELELLESPPGEKPQRAAAHTSSASPGDDPVADVAAVPERVDAHVDGAEQRTCLHVRDCERMTAGIARQALAHVGIGVGT